MEACLLVGPSSVIGNAIAEALINDEQIPLLKLGRTNYFEKLRIEGLNLVGSAHDTFEGSCDEIITYLQTLDFKIRFFILSTGYMAAPANQLEPQEVLNTNYANYLFPTVTALAFAKSSLFSRETILVLVSTALYSLPYQTKHFVYQIAKEQLERVLTQFWSLGGKSFRFIVIRPWHIATPLNAHIPSSKFSINSRSISKAVRKWIMTNADLDSRYSLEILYVPKSAKILVRVLRFLPKRVFLRAALAGAKASR